MQFPTLMTRQGQYLMIKQKLDSYNLSTTFPLQMMPLLQKLLTRLDQQVQRNNSTSSLSLNNQNTSLSVTKQFQLAYKHVDKAIKSQISKVVQQNNQLHLQIMALKQELQSWRHCIDKELIERSDNKEEMKRIIEFRNQRQQQLMEQVQVAKFRYNQLIEFIHEQDNLERMYIKRLYNHKKYELDQSKSMAHSKEEDLNSRITFKAHNPNTSSRQKQSRKRVNKTIDGHNASSISHPSHKFQLIDQKLKNRQKQIQRLHAIISHDGVNLNRVLHSFNEEQQKSKYLELQQRITYLEQEKHKLQKDLQKSVNTGGRYQALKEEVAKLQQHIKTLKEENKLLKRAKEQSDFDIEKQKKSINREMSLNNAKNVEMRVSHFNDYLTIEELRKKVDFYQKQLGIRAKQEKQLDKSGSKNKNKKDFTNALNKSVKVSKDVKGSKDKFKKQSSEQSRQKYEDQIKLNQKAQKKSSKKKAVSTKIPALNQKSKISRIPQESEEQSSEKDQRQNQQDKRNNQQNQNVNENSDEEQNDSQRQRSQSSQEQKKQTLIEQYQETINELTSKCTRQKEQIDLKNNAIVGLEQIATKLIKQDEQRQSQQLKLDNTEQSLKQLSTLKHQVQSLSSLLNESEFQKQELRRQLIQLQALYRKVSQNDQKEIVSEHQLNQQAFEELQELKQNLQLKDKKIQQMRQLKIQIEDRLLQALDRIKRLNDQIQLLTKDNQYLHTQLNSKDEALLSTINLLKEQQQRHSGTIQLSQVQKDEIIILRKNLIDAQNFITNLQTKITQLQSYTVLLEEENQTFKSNRPKSSYEFQ